MKFFQVSLLFRRLFTAHKAKQKFSTSLLLPWDKDHNPEFKHPSFFAPTEVRSSNVCAGYGRFTKEFIPKAAVIVRSHLVYIKDIQATNMDITDDMCFVVGNIKELEYLVDRYSNEANVSREVVRAGFGHFMAAPDVEGFCLIFSRSVYFNHIHTGECNSYPIYFDYNCITNEETIALYAARDINIGEEFLTDYEVFKFPPWYMHWCSDHQITNVRTWLNDEYLKEK